MRVDQFLAGFAPGDAISNEAIEIRRVLREMGFSSEIFVWPAFLHPQMRHQAHPITEYERPEGESALIYHFSTGNQMSEFVTGLPARKMMIYHNVTPSRYLTGYSQTVASELESGRKQLQALRNSFNLAVADSEFNRAELEAAGYSKTSVLPILLGLAKYSNRPDKRVQRLYRDEKTTILHVSRFVPNKCQHDLIKSFCIYQRFINSKSRLVMVGGHAIPSYFRQLTELVEELQLADVVMPGHVTDAELLAFYSASKVFVSLSEHEGFCVPIVESLLLGLPVIAFAAAAVPETLGRSGVLLDDKSPEVVAEAIHTVCNSEAVRDELVRRGKLRFETEFRPEVVSERLKVFVQQLTERPVSG